MTTKRDSKSKPKKAERPTLKKEKLSDLDAPDSQAGRVKGGGMKCCARAQSGCIS